MEFMVLFTGSDENYGIANYTDDLGNGGSEEATKVRLGGSFLLASELTITAIAFTNTLLPADFSSAISLFTETLEKFWRKKIQQPAATSFFIVLGLGLKNKNNDAFAQ